MQALLRHIYPSHCLLCDTLVTQDFALCPTCWPEVDFIAGLVCNHCGLPLPGEDDGAEVLCDDCIAIARPWSQGRSVMMYSGKGREMVLKLKHADRLDLLPAFGPWLARAAGPMLRPDTLIAPVPLHWFRLLRRKYNQSAMLTAALAKVTGLAHCPDLLLRRRATGSQDGRTRDGRFANIQGAISAHPRHRAKIAGRHILIVDDVMTSGATLAAAAEACLAHDAAGISVLTLCRVAKSN